VNPVFATLVVGQAIFTKVIDHFLGHFGEFGAGVLDVVSQFQGFGDHRGAIFDFLLVRRHLVHTLFGLFLVGLGLFQVDGGERVCETPPSTDERSLIFIALLAAAGSIVVELMFFASLATAFY
jgi:hypothetical protein